MRVQERLSFAGGRWLLLFPRNEHQTQVEHPITEMITGIDLVQAQSLRVASAAVVLSRRGKCVDMRLNVSNLCRAPFEGWRPSPGPSHIIKNHLGLGVRVDAGVRSGGEVSVFYDPMIAKLIVWGSTRKKRPLAVFERRYWIMKSSE